MTDLDFEGNRLTDELLTKKDKESLDKLVQFIKKQGVNTVKPGIPLLLELVFNVGSDGSLGRREPFSLPWLEDKYMKLVVLGEVWNLFEEEGVDWPFDHPPRTSFVEATRIAYRYLIQEGWSI